MKNENKTLEAIKRKFSGNETGIEKCYVESESFRELCEDYLYCDAMMRSLATDQQIEKKQQYREFRTALNELEEEIFFYLGRGPSASQ